MEFDKVVFNNFKYSVGLPHIKMNIPIPKPNLETFVRTHALDVVAIGSDIAKLLSFTSAINGDYNLTLGFIITSLGIDTGLARFEVAYKNSDKDSDKEKWNKLEMSGKWYYIPRSKFLNSLSETIYNNRISKAFSSYVLKP